MVDMLQAWHSRRGELQLWVPAVHTFPQVSAGILLDLASQAFLGVCNKLGAVLNKHHLVSPALPPLLSCGHPHVEEGLGWVQLELSLFSAWKGAHVSKYSCEPESSLLAPRYL